jgi:hypothetical protein
MSRRERTIAWGVGLLVGLLLLDWLVVTPGLDRWDEVDRRIAAADKRLAEARRVIARERAAQARWAALEERLHRGSLEGVLYFVDHLLTLASRAGTYFQKTEPQRVDARGDYKENTYDVRLQCGIRNLARFAYELDASPELLRVQRMQVTARPGGNVLDVNLQISTLELAQAAKKPDGNGADGGAKKNP